MLLLKLFQLFLVLVMYLKTTEMAIRSNIASSNSVKRLSFDLLFPDTGDFGKPIPMIIILESLGKVPFGTRVYSAHYMIMCFWAPVKQGLTWKRSGNITSEIKKLGLKLPMNLRYDRGYYFSTSATFYEYGNIEITAEVSRLSKVGLSETDRKHIKKKITIKVPQGCWPYIQIYECNSPFKPIKAQVTQHFNVKAKVIEDCMQSDEGYKYLFKWQVYDQVGQILLKTLHDTKVPTHFIQNYELKFNYNDDAQAQQIMILLTSTIGDKHVGVRCYLHIISGRVKAIIAGSDTRYVNYYKAITFNGSFSYNTDTTPGHPQELYYNWDCKSLQDVYNEFCQDSMSSLPAFTLAPNSLTNEKRYQFTLTVSALNDVSSVSNASQQVVVVETNVLSIDIICVLNCAMDVFDPREQVHLRAVCYDCGKQIIFYDWYVNDERIGQRRTMVITINPAKNFAEMKLKITAQNGDWSLAYKKLTKNHPPIQGTCVIEPDRGYEIKTRFRIACENFVDNFMPLSYFLTVKKVTHARSFTGIYNVLLPITKYVEVRICDALFVCKDKRIKVSVMPSLEIPENAGELRKQLKDNFQITQLLKKGDLSAWLILNAVATKIKTGEQAQVILEQFKNHQPNIVLDLGKMANLTRTLIEQLNPINEKKTMILTELLRILNDNFQIVINNGNVRDLGLYPYLNVTTACITFLTEFTNVAEALPLPPVEIYDIVSDKKLTADLVKDAEDRIMMMKDPEAIERSLIWLRASWQMERLINYLGLASVENLRPDEDVVRIITEAVAFEERCHYIDGLKGYTVNTADGLHKVNFSTELLNELCEGLDASHICVKVISLSRRLYWWFPVERQPSSRILIVRTFTAGRTFSKEAFLKNPLVYQVALGKYKPAQKLDSTKQKVRVELTKQNPDYHHHREEEDDKALAIYENIDDTWQWLMPIGVNLYAYPPPIQRQTQSNELTIKQDHVNYYSKSTKGESRHKRVVESDQEKISNTDVNNTMVNGSIYYYEELHIYRVKIDAATVLAVRFFHSTHDLRVLFLNNRKPKRIEIAQASCMVPAGTTNKTILFGNRCHKKTIAYMGLRIYEKHVSESCKNVLSERDPIENGPCNFSFVFQMRSCEYWVYDELEPHWSTKGCMPSMESHIGRGLTCYCDHISSYTAYVFNMVAVRLPVRSCSFQTMPINYELIIFHCILWSSLLLLLLGAWLYKNSSKSMSGKTICCTLLRDDENYDEEPHRFFLILKTGGNLTAGTTANVSLIFRTVTHDELHITIYQNVVKPILRSNSTRVFEMLTRDIRLPTVLGVYHDNAGRYPSWFVRSVQVIDANTQQRQTFIIDRWITGKDIVVITGKITHIGEPLLARKVLVRFTDSMERCFTNYFMFQPLVGNWRVEGSVYQLSRFERVCIWTAKVAVAITTSFLYYGSTTVDNYEEQRDYFVYVTWVHYDDAVIVCILSYIFVCIIDLFYLHCIIPISHKNVFHIPH